MVAVLEVRYPDWFWMAPEDSGIKKALCCKCGLTMPLERYDLFDDDAMCRYCEDVDV